MQSEQRQMHKCTAVQLIQAQLYVSGITANWQQIVNHNLNIGKLEPKVGVLAHGCAHSWPFEHQQKQEGFLQCQTPTLFPVL